MHLSWTRGKMASDGKPKASVLMRLLDRALVLP